ncbi:MAG: FAD-dependent oxidoreductase [Patescibacteria group bacterium]
MAKHRVVIVGGGFGGVKAALDLSADHRFHITLITDKTDFQYYPTLYRTATGGRRMISSIPLTELFQGKKVHILNDRVVSLDRQKRTVTTKVNHHVGYEALVLALGVQTNYFNIQGLKELSYGIKTTADAEEFKAHLHQQLITDQKLDLNYVVIGGGPTGIELAGVLPSYLRQIAKQHGLPRRAIHVDLIEAAPRLLPRMPKDISRRVARQLRRLGVKIYLNTAVQAQNADALMVNNKPIRSHTVVWTAGVMNNPFFANQAFQLAKNGKVRVDQFLQSEAGIYVIGDNADTPYSGMAQTALYDGGFVASNLVHLANKQDPKPYFAKKPIFVFPAGHHWAAVLWGKIRIYGRLGWMLRSLADLIAYHDYEPWQLASKRWVAENDEEEFCKICSNEAVLPTEA